MQSAWAIGYGAAAVVTALVLPRWGWRAVFFVGILPGVPDALGAAQRREPAMWRAARARPPAGRRSLRRHLPRRDAPPHDRGHDHERVHAVRLVGLQSVAARRICRCRSRPGGRGLSTGVMATFVVVMQIGMWFGYVTFGFVSDAIGRKRTYVVYLITAAMPHLRLHVHSRAARPPAARTVRRVLRDRLLQRLRRGDGRDLSDRTSARRRRASPTTSGASRAPRRPFAVGTLAQTHGFHVALLLTSAAFLLAALMWIWIPETKGRQLA